MTFTFKPGDKVAVHPDGPDGEYRTGVVIIERGDRVTVEFTIYPVMSGRRCWRRMFAKSDVSPLAEFLELRRKA